MNVIPTFVFLLFCQATAMVHAADSNFSKAEVDAMNREMKERDAKEKAAEAKRAEQIKKSGVQPVENSKYSSSEVNTQSRPMGSQPTRVEQYIPPTRSPSAPSTTTATSDSRALDAAVQAAIARGDFPRAKELALTPTHWQWINAAGEAYAKFQRDGVSIGMSMGEVRSSRWGEPLSINRTTNSSGDSEQWVYGSGRYLYFRNGRLSSIDN
jgi:hypothetical protein